MTNCMWRVVRQFRAKVHNCRLRCRYSQDTYTWRAKTNKLQTYYLLLLAWSRAYTLYETLLMIIYLLYRTPSEIKSVSVSLHACLRCSGSQTCFARGTLLWVTKSCGPFLYTLLWFLMASTFRSDCPRKTNSPADKTINTIKRFKTIQTKILKY